jgi:hypothetical protein
MIEHFSTIKIFVFGETKGRREERGQILLSNSGWGTNLEWTQYFGSQVSSRYKTTVRLYRDVTVTYQ